MQKTSTFVSMSIRFVLSTKSIYQTKISFELIGTLTIREEKIITRTTREWKYDEKKARMRRTTKMDS